VPPFSCGHGIRPYKSRDSAPAKAYYFSILASGDKAMFVRLRRSVGNVLGNVLYWVGCALAVVVLVQAIILSVSAGGPVVPALLGLGALIIWVAGMGIKYLFVRR
jgi:hypothetical protein